VAKERQIGSFFLGPQELKFIKRPKKKGPSTEHCATPLQITICDADFLNPQKSSI
jgi:hypothetical protein